MYSETSSHFNEPSGKFANSLTSPFSTAPFLGQSGGPEEDDFPLVGSARQYMPVQCPGCFMTKEPDVEAADDIFKNDAFAVDLVAVVKASMEISTATMYIE